ncbi:hypothetical protein [Streptomyces gilvus]|uniref:hypothetical protein n=1 Tax=Streptomyces gilvus TaxID=2920937 RepID=UPI001F0D7742|nr:hypothetical protein [Streptomyces sp. CME 23]MCH5678011.1 hypothetical protein [Streptomyces sp. CME 23]
MTREERRESIRRLVDAAPLLPPEDIDRLRALLSVGTRRPPAMSPQRPVARPAAA